MAIFIHTACSAAHAALEAAAAAGSSVEFKLHLFKFQYRLFTCSACHKVSSKHIEDDKTKIINNDKPTAFIGTTSSASNMDKTKCTGKHYTKGIYEHETKCIRHIGAFS